LEGNGILVNRVLLLPQRHQETKGADWFALATGISPSEARACSILSFSTALLFVLIRRLFQKESLVRISE